MNSNQWETIKPAWVPQNSIVALIQWVPKLTKTTMPSILRQRLLSRLQEPLDGNSEILPQLDQNQLEELVQWSDLIIFDYITGNYDRVASMQVNISFC